MIYGSVCSGIEAATVAWHPLGWKAAFYSEIEKFPSAVLAHHYPAVPNLGDFTTIRADQHEPIDLLVGGTPCQSFSIAGLRGGLGDDRGNLALEFLRLAQRARPRWVVWENVPGVFSSESHAAPDPSPPPPPMDLGCDGAEMETEDDYSSEEVHAFNSFLAGLSELGYGIAYRVLDAQFVRVDGFPGAVPQRRRRVFVVGYLGDWRRAAAVLFERASLLGDSAPGRKAGQGLTHDAAPCIAASGRGFERAGDTRGPDCVIAAFGGNDTSGPINVATARNAHGGPMGRLDFESETFVAHALRAEGFDASEDGTGRGTPLVPVAYNITPSNSNKDYNAREAAYAQSVTTDGGTPSARGGDVIAFDCKASGQSGFGVGEIASTMRAMGHSDSHQNGGGHQAVAFDMRGREGGSQFEGPHDTANIRAASGGSSRSYVAQTWAVRRLTPRECERLQGFPDDYTLIPWRGKEAPDGPRYKALGNSMAVNVMRWIGTRIEMVETPPASVQAD